MGAEKAGKETMKRPKFTPPASDMPLEDTRPMTAGKRMLLEALNGSGAKAAVVEPRTTERPTKYGNVRVEHDGEAFDSKLEHRVWLRLCASAVAVIRQVSLPLGGKRRMRPDFLVIHDVLPDGRFVGEFVDAKGMETEAWTLKAKWLEDKYGIKVRRETK